jgi:hypothetical protein
LIKACDTGKSFSSSPLTSSLKLLKTAEVDK